MQYVWNSEHTPRFPRLARYLTSYCLATKLETISAIVETDQSCCQWDLRSNHVEDEVSITRCEDPTAKFVRHEETWIDISVLRMRTLHRGHHNKGMLRSDWEEENTTIDDPINLLHIEEVSFEQILKTKTQLEPRRGTYRGPVGHEIA